jgi:hypothetical protein
MPNVVVTECVAHGLAALTQSGLVNERAALRKIATFVAGRLGRVTPEGERWFAYTPDGTTLIHNGSLLAAATLLRCGAINDDADAVSDGLQAAGTAARHQAMDGSWPYAEGALGGWSDSYHTGFIVECLVEACRRNAPAAVRHALVSGARYYTDTFFGPHGEPWYSTASRYPLDAMSASQALSVLPTLQDVAPGVNTIADRVASWSLAEMLRTPGRVTYQVHRGWSDHRQFPRWSVAPMAAALAGFGSSPVAQQEEDPNRVA